jgi:hypothetical protein
MWEDIDMIVSDSRPPASERWPSSHYLPTLLTDHTDECIDSHRKSSFLRYSTPYSSTDAITSKRQQSTKSKEVRQRSGSIPYAQKPSSKELLHHPCDFGYAQQQQPGGGEDFLTIIAQRMASHGRMSQRGLPIRDSTSAVAACEDLSAYLPSICQKNSAPSVTGVTTETSTSNSDMSCTTCHPEDTECQRQFGALCLDQLTTKGLATSPYRACWTLARHPQQEKNNAAPQQMDLASKDNAIWDEFLKVCHSPQIVGALSGLDAKCRLPSIDSADDFSTSPAHDMPPTVRQTVLGIWVILKNAKVREGECTRSLILTAVCQPSHKSLHGCVSSWIFPKCCLWKLVEHGYFSQCLSRTQQENQAIRSELLAYARLVALGSGELQQLQAGKCQDRATGLLGMCTAAITWRCTIIPYLSSKPGQHCKVEGQTDYSSAFDSQKVWLKCHNAQLHIIYIYVFPD